MTDDYTKSKINEAYGYMQNDSVRALKIFNNILEDDCENIEAINGKGSTLMKLNKIDEADECFDKSLAISPNSSAFINKGIIAKKKDNYQIALNYYEKAVQINPELNNIVSILKNEIIGINTKKQLTYNKYTQQANEYIKKGIEYKKDKKLWDALEMYDSAVSADHTCKNHVKILVNEIKGMLQNQLLFQTPDISNSEIDKLKIQSLTSLLIEENPKKALTLINLILDLNSDDLDALNYKASILFLFDECHEAVKCYDKCLEINPDYYYAVFNKGIVLRRMKCLREALECFDRLVEIPEYEKKSRAYQIEIIDKLRKK